MILSRVPDNGVYTIQNEENGNYRHLEMKILKDKMEFLKVIAEVSDELPF